MNKKMAFTANDLQTMKSTLMSAIVKLQEENATAAEKSSLIIPLFKIEELIARNAKK